MENNNKVIAPLIGNLVIFLIGFMSCFRAIFIQYDVLSTIKTFTVLSNIYLTITSFMSLIFYIVSLKKNEDITPFWMFVLKLTSVTTTTLTLLTVIFFLWPISNFDTNSMFGDACYFLHFFTPLMGIFSFVFLEKKKKLKMPIPLFSLIPVILYATFYIISVFSGGDANVGITDFYCFAHDPSSLKIDYLRSIISIVAMLGASFAISFVLSLLNNLVNKKEAR